MRTMLAHHASGLTMQQVALEMGISYSNVANTMQWVKERLGVRTLAGCCVRAYALELIYVPEDAPFRVLPTPLDGI